MAKYLVEHAMQSRLLIPISKCSVKRRRFVTGGGWARCWVMIAHAVIWYAGVHKHGSDAAGGVECWR